jgi:hypothetical protein
MDRIINYNFYHWGPFLFRADITKEEIDQAKKLCSKENEDYRKNLAGLLKHEHKVEPKKLFPIIAPYLQSYVKAYFDYRGKPIGGKLQLETAWVNYMVKNESNPLHTHEHDLSFVLFLEVPKNLLEEYNKQLGNSKPGSITFVYSLDDREELINQHTFFPSVGELFIFPACLNHFVNVFRCEGERISVSGNIKIK